jgi:hypothetical protein
VDHTHYNIRITITECLDTQRDFPSGGIYAPDYGRQAVGAIQRDPLSRVLREIQESYRAHGPYTLRSEPSGDLGTPLKDDHAVSLLHPRGEFIHRASMNAFHQRFWLDAASVHAGPAGTVFPPFEAKIFSIRSIL